MIFVTDLFQLTQPLMSNICTAHKKMFLQCTLSTLLQIGSCWTTHIKTWNEEYFVEHINQILFLIKTRFSILFYNQMVRKTRIKAKFYNILFIIYIWYSHFIKYSWITQIIAMTFPVNLQIYMGIIYSMHIRQFLPS